MELPTEILNSGIFADVVATYLGSSGEATVALYKRLEAFGPVGVVALNLFRAQKCSERAKVYRGRRYKDAAYGRKQWSMDNLCKVLAEHGDALGIVWGWKEDPAQEFHKWVLYVELPSGQVSFHTDRRGSGPEYGADWDGVRDASPGRIIRFVAEVLNANENRHQATGNRQP